MKTTRRLRPTNLELVERRASCRRLRVFRNSPTGYVLTGDGGHPQIACVATNSLEAELTVPVILYKRTRKHSSRSSPGSSTTTCYES